MTTKFNVGDKVLIKGTIKAIYVETNDNKPIYHIYIDGAGTTEAYTMRVKEDTVKSEADMREGKKNDN